MINIKRYNHLSFEELLTAINFTSLSWEFDVGGYNYSLKTSSYGTSPKYKSLGELRLWIEKELGWQVEAYHRPKEIHKA